MRLSNTSTTREGSIPTPIANPTPHPHPYPYPCPYPYPYPCPNPNPCPYQYPYQYPYPYSSLVLLARASRTPLIRTLTNHWHDDEMSSVAIPLAR